MSRASGGPSRRAVLSGLGGLGVLSLTGCGLRLERDAPKLPLLSTQSPHPDRRLLLETIDQLRALEAQASGGASDSWPARIAGMHRQQVQKLSQVAAGLGISVPQTAPTASASDAAELARSETGRTAEATMRSAWKATGDTRAMLVSVVVTRFVAAGLLGAAPDLPHGQAPSGAAAEALLRAVQPAAYGLQIVAARTAPNQRGAVNATLAWLSGARTELEEQSGHSPDALSYQLPERPTDAASAQKLSRDLLGRVVDACGSQVNAVAALGDSQQDWLTRVWTAAITDDVRRGAPLEPFPGLTA